MSASSQTVVRKKEINCSKGRERARYQVMRTIGRGAFGMVMLARKILDDGRLGDLYVIKQISGEISSFKREVQILNYLSYMGYDCPDCLGMRDIMYCLDKTKAFIIMDFISGYTVFEALKNKLVKTDPEKWWLCLGLAQAVSRLHKLGVAHLDLKLENVMIRRDDPLVIPYRVVIVDFGSACVQRDPSYFSEGEIHAMFKVPSDPWPICFDRKIIGGNPSELNVAPEASDLETYKNQFKFDIYAFGTMVYEIFHPKNKELVDIFPVSSAMYMMGSRRGEIPELIRQAVADISDLDAQQLIIMCTQLNPAERPTIDEIVRFIEEVLSPVEETDLFGGEGLVVGGDETPHLHEELVAPPVEEIEIDLFGGEGVVVGSPRVETPPHLRNLFS